MSDKSVAGNFDTATGLFVFGCVLVFVSGGLPFLASDKAVIPKDSDTEINSVVSDMDNELTEATLSEETDGELTTTVHGVNAGDWTLIAGAALVGGLVVGLRSWQSTTVGVAGLCAASVLLVTLLYLNDPVRVFDDPFRSEARPLVSPGTGVYVALVGGILQAGSTLWGYQHRWFSTQRYDHVVSSLFGSVTGTLGNSDQQTTDSDQQTTDSNRPNRRDRQPPEDQTDSTDQSRSSAADALIEAYVRSAASPDGKWIVDLPIGFSVSDEEEASTPIDPIDAVCLTSQEPALPETYPDGPQHFLEPMEYQPTVSKTDIFYRMHNVGSLRTETVAVVELDVGTPSFETIGKLASYRTLLEAEYGLTVTELILISTERDPAVDRLCRKVGIRVVNAG